MHPAEELMRAMEAEINSLRATRSRQAELLGRARTALAPFADEYALRPRQDSDFITQPWSGATYRQAAEAHAAIASSTLDAIRDELGGEQG